MTPPRFLFLRTPIIGIPAGSLLNFWPFERLAAPRVSAEKLKEEHDRMTAAWSDLDPAEKARVKGLSADLHMLRENEVVLKLDHAERLGRTY